jgi:hypothetical protein
MIHQEHGVWDNGNNIISCFANMMIHHKYKEKKNKNINETYQLEVNDLSNKLEVEYSKYLTNIFNQ